MGKVQCVPDSVESPGPHAGSVDPVPTPGTAPEAPATAPPTTPPATAPPAASPTAGPPADPPPSASPAAGVAPEADQPAARSPGLFRQSFELRPPHAVLFDFHGTLAQVEDPVDWVNAAAAECGVRLEPARATSLADRLLAAGRAGGPLPTRVPPHLIEVWANRDLYEYAHREAYTGLAATVQTGIEGLPDALYERVLRPTGWWAYEDTISTMAALQSAGILVAVVSNIGFDIRPVAAALDFDCYVDAWVLSYEYGRTKPDPAVFTHACKLLGVDPRRTLMVGDSPADAAAVNAGCRAYLVPAAGPGEVNGLTAVLHLTGQATRG
jgi:HAD superfamily hydrolase (TIGR01509 family)